MTVKELYYYLGSLLIVALVAIYAISKSLDFDDIEIPDQSVYVVDKMSSELINETTGYYLVLKQSSGRLDLLEVDVHEYYEVAVGKTISLKMYRLEK